MSGEDSIPSWEFFSANAEQTRRLGMHLGMLLLPGDVICLVGDLGSGKTTLVQGIAAGWGSTDNVTSPTFVLVNVYRKSGEQRMYHLDTYRLSEPQSTARAADTILRVAEDLDLETLIENGPLLIEWADRIQSILPEEHLKIHLSWVDDQQRQLALTAHGARYQEILDMVRAATHPIQTGDA